MREAAKWPMITLEELQRSTAQVGESVHRTTISPALHILALYGRVARREPLLKQSHAVCHKPCGGTTNMWRKVLWTDETKIWPKCKMLCVAEASAHHLEHTIHHHAVGMIFFVRDRKAGQSCIDVV